MGHVAYYRVSTKRQGESGLGLEAQQSIVRHYHDDIVAEFVEVESGKGGVHRPELEAAIKLCVYDNHILVVAKVDRLSRDTADTLSIYDRLDGRLRSCDLPGGEEDPAMFKFMLTLQAALAERERELISIRTKAALAAARARGVKLGNPDNLPADATKLQAEAKRQAAILAYQTTAGYVKMLRDEGLSYKHVADRLNSEGFETRQGKPFKAMTVWRVVQRAK